MKDSEAIEKERKRQKELDERDKRMKEFENGFSLKKLDDGFEYP